MITDINKTKQIKCHFHTTFNMTLKVMPRRCKGHICSPPLTEKFVITHSRSKLVLMQKEKSYAQGYERMKSTIVTFSNLTFKLPVVD